MSEESENYEEDGGGFDEEFGMDEQPVRDNKPSGSKSKTQGLPGGKSVKWQSSAGDPKQSFNKMNKDLKGLDKKPKAPVNYDELPKDLKKQVTAHEMEQKRKNLTLKDIISESHANKEIIYKFMRKGFIALSAEELATTMVNPDFSVDFKKNTGEDWHVNYQSKVVEKLQKCNFHMHWFTKTASASGYSDQHENFMKLVEKGNIEKVFQYMRSKDIANVLNSVEQKSKRSPLHIAAKFGHNHLVKFFIQKGADCGARDRLLKTPLHYSCENGQTLVVKELMDNGADPFEKDNCGRTSLHYAVYSGKTDLFALLTEHNIDIIHMKDHAGRYPLHHAVFMENNQILMIAKLIDYGAEVNCLDNDRRTPLHHAAEANKPKVCKILIEKGAQTNIKDTLKRKTPLELAANDHIRELIIAYTSPQYMPTEDQIMAKSAKEYRYPDVAVNKKGQIQKTVSYDPPGEYAFETPYVPPKPLKKKKTQGVRQNQQVIIQQVMPPQQAQQPLSIECPNCHAMKGLGPSSEWDKQQQQFLPYNMKNHQERLLGLLKRIQLFGVESFMFQKKPYLYSGSWMEYVKNLDDLMLQINGVNPNEACMKIFNVLFPYPKPLPIGVGDEQALSGFFDGMTNVDKQKVQRECLPSQLLENINNKKEGIAEEVMVKNDIQDVQDLLDIRQEVMQLRDANAAMQFAIEQKDMQIARLKGDSDDQLKEQQEASLLAADEKLLKLRMKNTALEEELARVKGEKYDLEDQLSRASVSMRQSQAAPKSSVPAGALAKKMEALIEEKENLQKMYDEVNERNKAMRSKAGQVFLDSLKSGAHIAGKASVKGGKVYLEDEEAIQRMGNEIAIRRNGELRDWLSRFSFSGVDDISLKQYKDMIEKGLQMSANDLIKLIRVAGFDELKSKDKKMKIETVALNIEKRLAESTAERGRCIKKVADQMVKKGFDLQQAMRYFDTDGSGEITREELKEGFDNMNVPLNEALRNNLFVVLDGNGDNEISVTEFEAVFGQYLGAGGPVQDVEAEDLVNELVDEETAADLAKNMKAEQKQAQVYTDQKLEAKTDDELADLEDQRVQDIKAANIPDQKVAGELIFKIDKGNGLPELPGKEQLAFSITMPKYDNKGTLMTSGDSVQLKMMDPETGKIRIKTRILLKDENLFMFQEAMKVQVYRLGADETDKSFKIADKTNIGCILIMWKECVTAEVDGQTQLLQYQETFRDPEGLVTVSLAGQLSGELRFVKFGEKDSKYSADGVKKDAPKKVAEASDFKGPRVGSGGTLFVTHKKYMTDTDLSMSRNYQVAYELRNLDDEKAQESLGLATEPTMQQANLLKWMDQVQLPINDINQEVRLLVTLQTEQVGITKGEPIAIGEADLAALKIFTEKDAKGEFKTLGNIELTDPHGTDPNSKIQIRLKFKPNPDAAPPKEVSQEEQQAEENVEEILDDEVVNE